MNNIKQLADAFAAGVAFARSAGLAMDAAEEDKGFWRTIRGRKIHFGPDGKATNAPDWLKSASTGGTESSKSPKDLAALVGKRYGELEDKIRYRYEYTYDDIDKIGEPDYKLPGANLANETRIKTGLNTIKTWSESMADYVGMTTQEVVDAIENGDLTKTDAEGIWRKLRAIEKEAKDLVNRTSAAIRGLKKAKARDYKDLADDITALKDETVKLDGKTYHLYSETIKAIRSSKERR